MVADYRGGGPNLFWGDAPVGDFDVRYFCPSGPALLIGEFKWGDYEIERDEGQRKIYRGIVEVFGPYLWIVYITGTAMPDEKGRLLVKCERFYRLMPDGSLNEIVIPDLPNKGGNLASFLPYFERKCRKEILQKNIKAAANDNHPRFVPDYRKRRG